MYWKGSLAWEVEAIVQLWGFSLSNFEGKGKNPLRQEISMVRKFLVIVLLPSLITTVGMAQVMSNQEIRDYFAQYEQNSHLLAKAFAQALPDIKDELYQAILSSTEREHKVELISFLEKGTKTASVIVEKEFMAEKRLYEILNLYPFLSVYVPYQCPEWNGKDVPLVVAGPPDENVDFVYAYDSQGEEYMLDAYTPPTDPVVVITHESFEAGFAVTRQAEGADCKVKHFIYYESYERWFQGEPEFYIKCFHEDSISGAYGHDGRINF
jgi:hypothetical protein